VTDRKGPFEEGTWSERLTALCVERSPHYRLHGYEIEQDLARHYGIAEVMLLALAGEAPSLACGKAFEAALLFACPCPVDEAPTHGARLARSFGAPVTSAVAAGMLLGLEAAQAEVHHHRELLCWLSDGRRGTLPECARATHERDAASVEELTRCIGEAHGDLAPPPMASRMAAVIAVMWACGLRSEDQLAIALWWAKAVSIAAETVAASRGGLVKFPVLLPNFRYEAPPR
jgi:hypothetical protein